MITNSIGMELVLLPAGEFLMGTADSDTDASADEKPQHRVRITEDFYLGETEVTQGQWKSVMGTEPWQWKGSVQAGTDNAASWISWEEADSFCHMLSVKEGKAYRLPSEAEWEYACRGGTTTIYSFGDSSTNLSEYAWYERNASGIGENYAHRVRQKKANPFGLYDMHGNVWEWCRDRYDEKYYKTSPDRDPEGAFSRNFRVLRGGSWNYGPQNTRSSNRDGDSPGIRNYGTGFRVSRTQ